MSSKEANERRLEPMTEADLHDLLDRATAYTDRLIQSKNWRGSKGGVFPAGKSAQDLVQAAFEKILEGAKWDEDKDLSMVLCGIIRGAVGNLATSWENRNFSNPDDLAESEDKDGWVSAVDRFASSEESADRKASRKEDEDLLLSIIEDLKEGSEERRIVESVVFAGAGKRAEVLSDTGLSEKEYEAAKKRLQRFLVNYRRETAAAHQ